MRAMCFARAKPRVIGGSVADLLATDCILLVIERKRCFRHGVDVQVIQRVSPRRHTGGQQW